MTNEGGLEASTRPPRSMRCYNGSSLYRLSETIARRPDSPESHLETDASACIFSQAVAKSARDPGCSIPTITAPVASPANVACQARIFMFGVTLLIKPLPFLSCAVYAATSSVSTITTRSVEFPSANTAVDRERVRPSRIDAINPFIFFNLIVYPAITGAVVL